MLSAMNVAPAGIGLSDNAPQARNAEEAAGQFEALLIGQLLQSMRESGGWLGCEDSASESLMGLAEQQLSVVLASQGGLGVARLVAERLQGVDGGRGEARSHSVPK